MHVFRPTYTDRTGQLVQARCWYIEYRDPAVVGTPNRRGVPRTTDAVRVKGYADRKSTDQLAARLQRDLDRRAAGLQTADMDQAVRPLAEHLADYRAHLTSKGDVAEHIKLTGSRLAALAAGCGWSRATAIAGDAALQWLRTDLMGRQGCGPVTANGYLRALKGLAAWLAGNGRLPSDPLARLRGFRFSEDADLRHHRRALADVEFLALVVAAAASTAAAYGLTGPDRAALYLVAAYSGLRATALSGLTPAAFDLAGELLTVEASWQKSRRRHTVPLHPDLARRLADWLARKPAGVPVWPGNWARHHHAAELLRLDLAAAGVPYRTAEGVFDFHALRSQLVVMLWRAGVDALAASKLAGHSNPAITARHYARLSRTDLGGQVARLPAPPLLPALGAALGAGTARDGSDVAPGRPGLKGYQKPRKRQAPREN